MGLYRKIWRTIRESKSQYVGAAVLIALCCLLFSVFNTMGTDVTNNLAFFKTENVQEDAYFILTGELGDAPALERKYDLLLERRGAADFDYADGVTLRVLSETKKVDLHAVVGGEDIQSDHDVLVDPEFAKAHDIKIGVTVELFGEPFTVTGYVCTPDYIYPLKNDADLVKSPDAFGIAVVSAEAFAGLRQGYMFYSVKYGDTDTDAFKSELAADSEIVRWVDKEDNMRISFIEGDIKGIGPMGTVLPMAILLVTCVMVAVVLWRLLKREFTQIGVFYAIGYRKHEILRHYMRYPVLIATAGGITGTALSIPFIRPFIAFVSTFYNLPVFRVTYRPGVFILSVVLPFLFLLPTALFVIWKALRLSPLQLLKGGVKKTKSNFFERTLRLRRFRFSTKFRIREVVRNIPRSLLMLLGVVCASALLLIGFGMKDSMDYLLSNSFENTFRYNYIYMFNSLQTEEPEQGEKVSLSTFKVLVENYTETVTVYGIEESAALIRLTDAEGRKLDYNQVIITRSLADRYGLSPGDTLSVQNTYTLEKFTLQVDAVAAYYLGDEIYMPLDRFNGMMGYPSGSYLELYTEQKLSAPVSEFVSVTDRSYIEKSFQSLMAPLRAMSGIIGVLSFGIGLIILYVVTSLVIEENRDSISLMKVLGYDKKRLYGLILSPYTAFVIVGYGLAVPLILVSLQQFFQEMTAEMSMSIPARLDPWSILFGFVILMFSYQLSKWLNRRKINRVSMSETLKSARE